MHYTLHVSRAALKLSVIDYVVLCYILHYVEYSYALNIRLCAITSLKKALENLESTLDIKSSMMYLG